MQTGKHDSAAVEREYVSARSGGPVHGDGDWVNLDRGGSNEESEESEEGEKQQDTEQMQEDPQVQRLEIELAAAKVRISSLEVENLRLRREGERSTNQTKHYEDLVARKEQELVRMHEQEYEQVMEHWAVILDECF